MIVVVALVELQVRRVRAGWHAFMVVLAERRAIQAGERGQRRGNGEDAELHGDGSFGRPVGSARPPALIQCADCVLGIAATQRFLAALSTPNP